MAEAVGTALAVVGVLGQVFDGCVKAYSYFSRAASFDADSQRLVCKVRIEETRLVVWGREWGVAEGRLEKHLSQVDIGGGGGGVGKLVDGGGSGGSGGLLRNMALEILNNLHATITDVQKLKGRYGLVDGDEKDGGKRMEPSARRSSSDVRNVGDKMKGLTIRARWVVAGELVIIQSFYKTARLRFTDKDKFDSLLADLKHFNDGLEQLFPASRIPGVQRTWVFEMLHAAKDVEQLSVLEKASDETYPKLNASASLKKLRVNLDSTPQQKFRPTYALKVQRHALKLSDTDTKRSEAFHDPKGNVIIEWVDYDKEDLDGRVVHMRRLDDLARIMHLAVDRHPDLHTIDCLGYTDDTAMSRYGLVYRAPEPSYSTLHKLISTNEFKTPDLNDRIRLAHTLSVALLSLHSLDWLHKSLCSNNILFFPSPFSASATRATASAALVPDISNPYLVGFDASRPELDTEMSVAPKNPSILDLHRHPKSLSGPSRRPYCKSYDLYSLGLVLLEIGDWKVLQTYYRPHYSAERWRDKIILPQLLPRLGAKVGRLYRDLVEKCLTAKDDISSEDAAQLMEEVVATLEKINV
ncbi:hypothetical protein PFICI_00906 [Pestalotiopsis fici W106-1]|uniref:Protein kinase domain-containing protein n=1 Tax=Pestalotiopsis fici (strain W106-1 / CGMCC3.15140) TaxID=1229662 RepID=W3XLZ0_PESFW|nr:uncharacterized protein PFICI_00906 [Pestalotiopsis fici W106-1]ETS87078.1 hypothetical protein PFICI_00906 [Pestalotiopsis fici W106-1]